jgi:hypothetical protein
MISDATDALPHKAHLIADQDFGAVLDAVERGDVRAWIGLTRVMYECSDCGRLWLNDAGGKLHAFSPEGDAKPLLRSIQSGA